VVTTDPEFFYSEFFLLMATSVTARKEFYLIILSYAEFIYIVTGMSGMMSIDNYRRKAT
jgi:hypothetical protein